MLTSPTATVPTNGDGTSPSVGIVTTQRHGTERISRQQVTPPTSRLDRFEAWGQLVAALCESDDAQAACQKLARELQRRLGCLRVGVGLRRSASGSCKLMALSDVVQFSARSEMVRQVEAAMDEAMLRKEVTLWPASDAADPPRGHAHRQLSAAMGNIPVISVPLCGEGTSCHGALVLMGAELMQSLESIREFSTVPARTIGSVLRMLQQSTMWSRAYFWRMLGRDGKRERLIAAATGLLLISAVLCAPVPYRMSCECNVQPVARRFVVAPFDGALEETLTFPGDVVKADQPLARLDGREIRCELAAISADLSRVSKERDTALAKGTTAAAQMARLEMERLELKAEVLRQRESQLVIRSPISGILISGDLKKIEGAKLSVGQSLFEIGPLDQMIIEIAIPESEVNHAKPGADVRLRLDAVDGRSWTGTLEKIHPRSEIRDDRNVFVAEVKLHNENGVLRPGMKGTAKISGSTHLLAWNLFHKPWNALLKWLGV